MTPHKVYAPVRPSKVGFNETLHLTGNCWMKLDLGTAYTVTANTILEFDFSSNAEGEIHGIGFDVDNTVDPSHLFQVYGTQVYATTQAFNNYSTSAPGTAHYIIPVGTFFTGAFQYLTFANDMDAAPQTAESIYTNIQVYEGTPPPPLMLTVNGANYPVESYDPAQDVGPSTVTVEDGGLTLHTVGNTWKRVGIPYNVTADTVVEFDFSSSVQGEIHGIGFDVDNTIDANTFQLYGTQVYGIQAFNNYSASAPSVVHYTIPVGTFFTGNFLYLTFANDQDVAAPTGESVFSNIVIHDNQATPTITFNQAPLAEYPGADFTVNAITDSDGALTYSYVSGPCVLVDAILGTFSPTGFGDCVVQANTAATALFLTGSAQQTVTITAPVVDLYAVSGTTALPGTSVTVWGYSIANSPVTQPGGPTLIVNQGDTVSINLHNELGVNTALLFQGQEMIPDMTGVAAGGTKNYTFTASRPGTYLYEAGLIPGAQYQTAMGLYGALIVRPATAGQAYDDATTAYDDQAVLVLSEIDPDLNNSATPATFDMRHFAAKYFLINGKAYPATDAIATLPGNNVLLRYVNASLLQHSMTTLGVDQQVIANDGSPLQLLAPHGG